MNQGKAPNLERRREIEKRIAKIKQSAPHSKLQVTENLQGDKITFSRTLAQKPQNNGLAEIDQVPISSFVSKNRGVLKPPAESSPTGREKSTAGSRQ